MVNISHLILTLLFYVINGSYNIKAKFCAKRSVKFLKKFIVLQIAFNFVQQPYIPLLSSTIFSSHSFAHAVDSYETFDFNDVNRLKKGLKELNFLLINWKEKTLFCNFGEFQTDLLTVDNKNQLL